MTAQRKQKQREHPRAPWLTKCRKGTRVRGINREVYRHEMQRRLRLSEAAKAARTAAGVRMADVAEHFGVSHAAVSYWEQGTTYRWPGGEAEMFEYINAVRRISEARR